MKKLFKKLGATSTLAIVFASILLPIQISFAQSAATEYEPIAGEQCIDDQDKRIAVVLEESLDSGTYTPTDAFKEADEKEFQGSEIRTCFRITVCKVELVTVTGGAIVADDSAGKTVKKNICRTELRRDCPDQYRKNKNQLTLNSKPNEESAYCQKVQLLMTDKGGAGLIYLYVGTIYRWATSIIGIIAVLIMIVNGIAISASAGDTQAVTNAKNRIVQSLAALVILFLSGLILYTANPNFFDGQSANQKIQEVLQEVPSYADLSEKTPEEVEKWWKSLTPKQRQIIEKNGLVPGAVDNNKLDIEDVKDTNTDDTMAA